MDLTFYKYEFEKAGEHIKRNTMSKINETYYTIVDTMGLSESSLTAITKPFSFLSHCKVSCDSPCCTKLCGEDNHCVFNIDTHENVISDSDEDEYADEHISSKSLKSVVIIYFFAGSYRDGQI